MEKIFNKIMKVISCFLLSMFVISSVWGGVQASGEDSREYTEWTDNSEAICIAYSETPESCLGESHAAATAETSLKGNLDVLGLGIMGTGWLGAEAEDKISTVKPELVARIGNGVVGTLDNGLKTALYSYPGEVTMYNAIYQDWSPSRMNQAEAASSGTVILSPVRKLFEYVRGIAYVGSVLIIVVIAFMIMFRQKVGGQVAVTITNALPRVLIGFILIHFSFWIASVILSLSTFLMAIAEVAITNAIVDISGFSDVQTIGLGGPVHLWWNIFHWVLGPTAVKDSTSGIGGWVGGLFGVNPVRSFFESKASLSTIPTVARSMWSMGVDLSIGGIIVKLVFAVGLIFAVFKIFFNLIKAYAQIFLKVIALPITTLFGMFPVKKINYRIIQIYTCRFLSVSINFYNY